MNILVLNGSPGGKNSITLCTVRYLKKHFPEHRFVVLDVGQRIRQMENQQELWIGLMEKADLILFCYPVYTFLVPSQLHRFVELMKESGIDFRGKYATQITTSKHFYDITAHRFVEENCADMGLKVIRGLSADMEDLLSEGGRKDAEAFFRYVLWNMKKGFEERICLGKKSRTALRIADPSAEQLKAPSPGRIVIVADFSYSEKNRLQNMCERLKNLLPCETEILNIQEFPFAGGCLGCFRCASEGKCIYKDGFDAYLREKIQSADGLVYAYTVKDHSMGYRFKVFDDRQFCNGHRTVTMGKPVAYLVDGKLDAEENLRVLMEARSQVGGNALAGIATDQTDPNGEIDRLAENLCYMIAEGYLPPKNFYGVGGMKIFRDLIWQMQGLMREDHKFYRAHGFYDFPQKHPLKMLAMYLVGYAMKNPKIMKKMNGDLTKGMLLPYRKAMASEGKRLNRKKN